MPGSEARIGKEELKSPNPIHRMNDASPDPVVYIGVDASLKSLDLFGLPRTKLLPNTAAAHQKLIGRLPPHVHVIMEASGGCEHELWLALLKASVKVSRVNPAKVRYYARANGQLAKKATAAIAIAKSGTFPSNRAAP